MKERLGFAVPDLDQLLDQLEVELAADEKSHDKPGITDRPVDDDVPRGNIPSEREVHESIVAMAHEDFKSDGTRPPPKPKPGGSLRPPPKPKPRGSSRPASEPGSSVRPPPQPVPVVGQPSRLHLTLIALADRG